MSECSGPDCTHPSHGLLRLPAVRVIRLTYLVPSMKYLCVKLLWDSRVD